MSTGTPNIRTRGLSRLSSVPTGKFRNSTAFTSRPLPSTSLADSPTTRYWISSPQVVKPHSICLTTYTPISGMVTALKIESTQTMRHRAPHLVIGVFTRDFLKMEMIGYPETSVRNYITRFVIAQKSTVLMVIFAWHSPYILYGQEAEFFSVTSSGTFPKDCVLKAQVLLPGHTDTLKIKAARFFETSGSHYPVTHPEHGIVSQVRSEVGKTGQLLVYSLHKYFCCSHYCQQHQL
jgi:hypothetical protein